MATFKNKKVMQIVNPPGQKLTVSFSVLITSEGDDSCDRDHFKIVIVVVVVTSPLKKCDGRWSSSVIVLIKK